MTTPALRVNGLQIVAHDAPLAPNGFGPFSGIEIHAQTQAPPHSSSGGVLWSDGDTLHWSTPAGHDVALPRITGSQLLAVDDANAMMHAQVEGQIIAGAIGGGSVLAVLLLVRLGYWLIRKAEVAAWIARQRRGDGGLYRESVANADSSGDGGSK